MFPLIEYIALLFMYQTRTLYVHFGGKKEREQTKEKVFFNSQSSLEQRLLCRYERVNLSEFYPEARIIISH